MKFYSDMLSLVVWDADKNVGISFVNGEYETSNKHEIELLKKAGYSSDEPVRSLPAGVEPLPFEPEEEEEEIFEYERPETVDYKDKTVIQLRELCKEQDIPSSGKNKAELIDALKGVAE